MPHVVFTKYTMYKVCCVTHWIWLASHNLGFQDQQNLQMVFVWGQDYCITGSCDDHVILLQLVVHTSQYHMTLWWNSWTIILSCHPLCCLLICPWSHRAVIGEWVWPLMWLIFVYKYIASVISLFGDVMGNPIVLYNNTCECMEQFYCIVCVGVWYVSVHHIIITSWWFHQTGQLLCSVCFLVCVLVAMVSIYVDILSSQRHL